MRFSRILLKICKSFLVKMAMNYKHSGLNGKIPANFRVKKAKEAVSGSCGGWKWRRLLLLLWVPIVLFGLIWLLFGLNDRILKKEVESRSMFEVKALVLLQFFDIRKEKVHDLAASFFRLNQLLFGLGPIIMRASLVTQGIFQALNTSIMLMRKIMTALIFVFSKGVDWFFVWFDIYQNALRTKAIVSLARELCGSFTFCLAKICVSIIVVMAVSYKIPSMLDNLWSKRKQNLVLHHKQNELVQMSFSRKQNLILQRMEEKKAEAGKWRKKLLILFVVAGVTLSIWLFWYINSDIRFKRKETLANMCDERARMLQDQFNVSMNHVHALAILVSTFHHGKVPSAIDQITFGEYAESTAFERPLTSGVAYALRVRHTEREQFEKKHGWTIKKMEIEDQTLVQDCNPEHLEPSPVQDEYAPVIFSQETVSHIVSIDMMSGKEDHENILRARASGKGVLTSPFKLLKSNHLGVVLTFAVYGTRLPPDVTPEQRINATVGYLGASYDVPSLVEKLLHQLASKQTIVVNVYDTTNATKPINMYGSTNVTDTGLLRISSLDFGDPARKHEMHCRFKHKPSPPVAAITAFAGVLTITCLLGHIFHAAINRITKVERDYREMMDLKHRAEAADIAKSQFLATVSHEIRTPMNGVLGMLQMLMDTNLDAKQLDFAQTAHASGKDLISLINEVLDQAKIESGRLELEAVPFDPRAILDNVLSLFSGKSHEKGIELAVYVSGEVPEFVVGDPGRFRQIITNLVGNSIKFTHDRGHIFVTVHLVDEVRSSLNMKDKVLHQSIALGQNSSNISHITLSGFPVVERQKSWTDFKNLSGAEFPKESDMIKMLVTVEDTGVGIPPDAQARIFMPFMQADSSTSRTYGGTGIGLSISKRLVDLMGGEIGFVSEPGTGSTFSFTAAFAKLDVGPSDRLLLQYNPASTEFRGLKALMIDVKNIRAEVTKYHLQRLGISVDITCSLDSALSCISSYFKKSGPVRLDMVFIDQETWDEEISISLQRNLKDLRPEIAPKMFLLGTSIRCNEIKAANLVDNVVAKPLRLSVLVSCLEETFVNKRRVTRIKPTLGVLLRKKKILVVDDVAVNRRVAEGALKKYGALVTCVESGKAAFEMLKPPHDFDACFMDLQMPEVDGFEATRQIRREEKKVNEQIQSGEVSVEMFANVGHWHTPILAMTADVIQATDEECMKCGMDGYVSKPFEEEQLYSAAARFFESG